MADSERAQWSKLSRARPLALLIDLDGTLIPFAATPDLARPSPSVVALLADLSAEPGTLVAIVSGRPRQALESFFPSGGALKLVAEHGGWRRDGATWTRAVEISEHDVSSLADQLADLALTRAGALVERKTWSVAFHSRGLPPAERDAVVVEVEHRVAAWLKSHPSFEVLRGAEVLEVRPSAMTKASAVGWVREQAGDGATLVALGDDVTDEDMFHALAETDESVLVGGDGKRATAARWQLDAPENTVGFLRWLLAARRGDPAGGSLDIPRRLGSRSDIPSSTYRLLVVSNRLPELRSTADSADPRKRSVGGLVSAVEPALRARDGVWLGWSGRTSPNADATAFGLDDEATPKLAWVDLPEKWRDRYYNGLCNSALWPLLHSFPSRVRLAEEDWEAYRHANEAFATAAMRIVGPDSAIWIHDYHLFLLGERLRRRGHRGPIGLFLHVPFPGPDIFSLLPWAEEIIVAMLSLDLVGFHTPGSVENFLQCVAIVPGVRVDGWNVEYRGRKVRVGAFPIGIIPEGFQEPPTASTAQEVASLMNAIAPTRLVLGVDRLDYTKGIPERLMAFARMLELYPHWRRKVSLVQISVPSRGDVPDYAEQRDQVERIVGRTNGDFGDADWVPIRYLYRSFGRNQLSHLYRAAAIGYVTPLRDGMNLVAKEYVAAQDPEDPGVLVLSRFAGAAAELTDAVLTNPWYIDGLAEDLDGALRMGIEERRWRHKQLFASVSKTTALTWAEDILSALSSASEGTST